MKIYCTVCSRKKLETDQSVEAVNLYLSENIRNVYEKSMREGIEFRILSGKFGLLRPDEKIRRYDYLLKDDAVNELKEKIKNQMKSQEIDDITFFAENREEHPNWIPYYNSIIRACNELEIKLKLVEI